MEDDVVTAVPPPSRFFPDDLYIFAPPPPPTPPPFLVLPSTSLLRPRLFLIAASTPSLRLLPSSKSLVGTLPFPDLPVSHSSILYTLPDSPGTLVLAIHRQIPPERARSVAKSVFAAIHPEQVLILDSIRRVNFHGRLSVDEAVAFKLETTEQRRNGVVVGVEYMPSGSVMDGVGAALLGECEMKKVNATLVGTWPDKADPSVLSLLRSLIEHVLPGLGVPENAASITGLDTDLLYA